MQRGGLRELVSGCRDGEVKFWDLRWQDEVKTVNALGTGKDGGVMRGLSVHEHAPVFAALVVLSTSHPMPWVSPFTPSHFPFTSSCPHEY